MIYKPVKEFEGYYEVSSLGEVKSLERKSHNGKGPTVYKEKKLNPFQANTNCGTLYVTLQAEDKKRTYQIKDLVASHFLKLPTEYPEEFYTVYQKDENVKNCAVDNLYYGINKHAVRLFDLEGNMLGDYPSIQEVEKVVNKKCGAALTNNCNGVSNYFEHYQARWLVKGMKIKNIPSVINERRSDVSPVAKYWNGNLVCVYNSITEAAEKNFLEPSHVGSMVVRGTKIKNFEFKRIKV